MTLARYLAAWAAAAALVVPISVTSHRLRRRYLPWLTGAVGWLADLVLTIALLVGLAQVLGAVGLFALGPLVIGALLIGAIGLVGLRAPVPAVHPGTARDRPQVPRLDRALAAIGIGLASLPFLGATLESLRRGITEYDSNWYHLPIAGGFAQDGWTTRLHFTGSVPATYFPANAELLHGIGMLVTGTDVLSPMVNLGWLALALLAAWCIGLRAGRPGLAVLSLAVLLSLPIMTSSQGGTAGVDLAGVAMLLAAIALVVHAVDGEPRRASLLLVAAAAAGVLVGIKLIYLPIVVALAAAVVVAVPLARRPRQLAAGLGVLALTGSYWYLRNLLRVGSPLPSAPLRLGGIGFVHVPDGTIDCGTRSVASYATQPSIWRSTFAPALRYWFGPLWWLVLIAMITALVAGLVRPRRVSPRIVNGGNVDGGHRDTRKVTGRIIAITGIVATVTYVFTPATAGGAPGSQHCFGYDTRFLFPALVLAAMAAVLVISSASLQRMITVVLVGMLAVTHWASIRFPAGIGPKRDAFFALVVAAAGCGWLLIRRCEHRRRRPGVWTMATAVVAVVALGWPAAHNWPARRTVGRHLTDLGSLPVWADSSPKKRIAIAGFFEQWPLYGSRFQNVVRLATVEQGRGVLRSPTDCDTWRRALRSGGFDHVVILAEHPPAQPPELEWIAGDPAATRFVIEGTQASAYRFNPKAPASPCNSR